MGTRKFMNKRPKGESQMKRTVVTASISFIATVLPLQPVAAADTTWLKEAKYGLMVEWANTGKEPYVNDITGSYADGTWNDTVETFNASTFADQVAATGAGYVIFAVGQTSGYYCAHNYAYAYTLEQACPLCGFGGFMPTNRDLIEDVADALDYYGIKLMVYFAADGPRCDAVTSLDKPTFQSALGMYLDCNDTDETKHNQAWSSANRQLIVNMVAVWSNTWGSKVAGWWLDAAYVNGWNRPDHEEPTLDDLIAACKSGNPDAIVATSPGPGKYEPDTWDSRKTRSWFYTPFDGLSAGQDFLAAEENLFGRFPLSQHVNVFGNENVQWHVTSFLGDGWSTPGTKYEDEYLAKYIKGVNQEGGAVTLDIAPYADGSLLWSQFDQLRYHVMPVVREGAGTTYEDIARLKPVHVLSNNSITEFELYDLPKPA
jgi:hypothetical protein